MNVDCLVGGGVLSTQAVAVNDAAAGDMIELRKGRERETFTARAVGPGKAVLDQSNDSTSTGTLVDASRAHSGAMP